MAKEFDIYLNNRLTQCDIIVYSIPYRDGLTAVNRVILESCVESYVLSKFIAVQTGSELVHHIDEMLKTCYERLGVGMQFCTSADFNVLYSIYPEQSRIELSQDKIVMLGTIFTDVNSALQIAAEPLLVFIGKSVGRGGSEIQFEQSVQQTLKNSIEQFSSPTELLADIEQTGKQSFLNVGGDIIVSSDVINLCYRITTSINTAIAVSASVLGTEFHFSLGSGNSAVVIGSSIDKGDIAHKYIIAQNVVDILAEAIESITQYMSPDTNALEFVSDVTAIIKRHRLLYEMDSDTLSIYDDMSLDDVDYVIL